MCQTEYIETETCMQRLKTQERAGLYLFNPVYIGTSYWQRNRRLLNYKIDQEQTSEAFDITDMIWEKMFGNIKKEHWQESCRRL